MKINRNVIGSVLKYCQNNINIRFQVKSNIGRQIQFYNFWNESFDTMYWYRFIHSNKTLLEALNDKTIGFYSVFGSRKIIEKTKCDINIFYSAENVRTRNNQYTDYFMNNHKVDLAMGFECFEDDRYIRFPNWLELFFLNSEDIPKICETLRYPNVNNKTKFVSCIARHDSVKGAVGLRGSIIDALSEIDTVTCAGKFRHNDDTLVSKYSDNKIEYLRDFYFNICPENSNGYGYVTEKIFQSIVAGCIPIYWGSYSNPEPDILNKDAIIIWEKDKDNTSSISLIRDLVRSPNLMKDFLSQPRLVKTAEEKISFIFNSLENRLLDIINNK